MKTVRASKSAQRRIGTRKAQERMLRVTEERNALKLQVLEKDEQLKISKVRLRKMMNILGQQERQISNFKQHKRPSGLPGDPRNRELEKAYIVAEQSQSRLSQKVKELERAKELLALRLNVVKSKRSTSPHGDGQMKAQRDARYHDRELQKAGNCELAQEEALVLVAALQQRLLEAVREKRGIQRRALQAFDDLQEEYEKGRDSQSSSAPSRDFHKSEMQRLHDELERTHSELRSSESARLRLLARAKISAHPAKMKKASSRKAHSHLEQKVEFYKVRVASHLLFVMMDALRLILLDYRTGLSSFKLLS